MAERTKMPRAQRAAQFAPFDALKGLHEALKIVEFNHERIVKGDLSEEQCKKISDNLLKVDKNSIVNLTYYYDGHNFNYTGKIKLEIEKQRILFDKKNINLNDLVDLEIVEKLT